MPSIEIPFAIGESLWKIGPADHEKWVTCEECAGSYKVTVTLATGESYKVNCAACSVGYSPPSGMRKATSRGREPVPFTSCRVGMSGGEFTYSEVEPGASSYTHSYAKDLFRDYEECARACASQDKADEEYREKNWVVQRVGKKHDLIWSVHYWRSERRRLQEDLVRVERQLGLCEERDRTKKTSGDAGGVV